MKKIYKYATGDEIPKGAVYLATVKQTEIERMYGDDTAPGYPKKEWIKCWLVWHYFLVDVAE